MNTTDLTKSPEEQKAFKPEDVLIIGIGVVAAFAIAYLLKKIKATIPHRPPPIIIKSGSFTIETDELLVNLPANPNDYKRTGFGEIKGVRVFKTNEVTDPEKPSEFEDATGITVDIRLQRHSSLTGWVNIVPPVTIRAVTNGSNPKDFVLTIGQKLSKEGRPKPERKDRWEDDDTEILRFGQIVVRRNSGGGETFDNLHGDDYLIAFYNELE